MASKGFLVGDHSIRPRHPVRYVATKQATKSTKRKKKKPEWDNTVNDLNVHKATKEEQIRRHELHKSKNVAKIPLQRQLKDHILDSTLQTPDIAERRKLAIVQEVLYGHDKLQDVLSTSDKAMSVVKDLFGDDPKKFMGFPNITAAPSLYGKENKFVVGPVAEPPETPTHLSLLSDSVMRTPALNELSDDGKEEKALSPESPSEQDLTKQPGSSFQPMLDLQRFQQFVAQEKSRDIENQTQFLSNGHGTDQVVAYGPGTHHVASHGHGNPNPGPDKPKAGPDIYPQASQPFVHPQAAIPSATDVQIMTGGSVAVPSVYDPQHVATQGSLASVAGQISEPSSFLSQKSTEVVAGGPNFVIPVTTGETTTTSAIPPNVRSSSRNAEADHQRLIKTKARTKTEQPTLNSSSSGLRSLDDLKKMVEELETEIAAYESETGRQQTGVSTATGNFSGYTASLITAVTKLMGYLKESEIQRKAEMVMREQVLQGFEEQRVLVDALTNDILHTQEQNLALQHELMEYKKNTDEQLQYLKRELFAVLRSHEYQALSSSINTLYSLNPTALKQRTFDALQPKQDENPNFEYLPGGPGSQAHQEKEQGRITSGPRSDFTAAPSFIPLATSQAQGIPHIKRPEAVSHPQVYQGHGASSMAALDQGTQASNKPVGQSQPLQQDKPVVSAETLYGIQHFEGSMAESYHQGPLNGPNSTAYRDLETAKIGMSGHAQIGSKILMYPPTQGRFTQENKVMTQMPSADLPGHNYSVPPANAQTAHRSLNGYSAAPLDRNERVLLSSIVGQPTPSSVPLITDQSAKLTSVEGNSATSTAHQVSVSGVMGPNTTSTTPLIRKEPASLSVTVGEPPASTSSTSYNPQSHLPGQSITNGQIPTTLWTTESPSNTSQGAPTCTQHAPVRHSQTMPSFAVPSNPSTGRQASRATQETVNVQTQHQHSPQQVLVQTSTQLLEHASKPRFFAPVSKAMSGGLPPGHQLRERLQNLANRQKSFAAQTVNQNVDNATALPLNTGNPRGVQQPRPTSLHVHFKDPPVASKEEGKHSPPVSPIPYKNTAVSRSSAPPDKRVVVNLPNAWSDVSSTISL